MRKLIRKLFKPSWGLPPDPHTTYCPSPEPDESLRKNWWQAISHRLSAISSLQTNIDKIKNILIKVRGIFRYIRNKPIVSKMLFLSDEKIKNQIIKDGEKRVIEEKSFLENLYHSNSYAEKVEEGKLFLKDFTKKSIEIFFESDIDNICNKSKELVDFVNLFINKNLEFLENDIKEAIWNTVRTVISLGEILSGLIRVEKSHKINKKLESIKIAYDGVERIATSVEAHIDVIPKEILITVKNLLSDISINTQKNEKYIEVFEDNGKKLFFDNSAAIKRTCNSTIFIIEKYIETKLVEQKEVELYPSVEVYNYINRQKELFKDLDKDILLKHRGKFVCFENGKIISSDFSKEIVIQKAIEKLGYKSIFVTKIEL